MNSILLKAFLFTACATFSYPIFAAQSETFQVSATIDTGCLINGALTEESNTQIGTIGELNFGEQNDEGRCAWDFGTVKYNDIIKYTEFSV